MDCEQFNRGAAELAADHERGASELARRALEVLAESASRQPARDLPELQARLRAQAARLAALRPSMVPIANLAGRWAARLTPGPDDDLAALRARAAAAAGELIAASRRAASEAADHAARLIGPGATVMTHSLSATVVAACDRLRGQGLRVIVTESRPLNEGNRLARRLADWGVPATWVTDAQMGCFAGEAGAVLVGADQVRPDGAVVNKAGTYLLALAARDQGIPFYACFEGFKLAAPGGPPPEMEEMAAAELGGEGWPGVVRRNVYFDLTPARLVTAWVTERGAARRAEELGGEGG